ncbi:L-type lectin-domain containing receptor kinase IX.1-like [Cryptomeria japonica]|uniref:L-type lectin-domain containing receptor kinase IX.1-like n=1 Tax=Cryptomeria japonica TaxID=3369 RepID=UPI0027D9E75E|nr:L-type lectin-domain containing receptor kinase IX.1-like [Cryptomeria japonica]
MANNSAWTFFHFFSLIVTLFSYIACAGNISFSFPPPTDLKLGFDAYFHWDELQLTTADATDDFAWSAGWAISNKPVPLWDKSSGALASFTAHFQFAMENLSDISSFTVSKASDSSTGVGSCAGEGLTFFIAPLHYEPPKDASGKWLGLFDQTRDGNSSNCIVAVEFDTFMEEYDPDDNHVGIDVNSVVSVANVSLSSEGRFKNNNLCNGEAWDAWVDYDGLTMEIKVFLLYNYGDDVSKPTSPILTYPIDLRDYVPEKVSVGLSASTGISAETHTVYAWKFSSAFLGEISPALPPSNVPSYPVSSHLKPPTMITYESPQKSSKKPSHVKVILISSSVCFLVICFLLFIGKIWYFNHRETRREYDGEEGNIELDEQFAQGPRKFSYAQLSAATRNFSEDELLGGGGFGSVYRGTLPVTNEAVAVKRISQESKQGKKEYITEVTIISKLRHRNLLRLLGWCHEQGELLLVYEFLPNGSLDKYLFDENKVCLNWDARYNIACGLASALIYLHEEWDQCVVHRDVKASNVLLDSYFNAKLGDFGLARLVESGHAASRTTIVAGTRGYLAPEYIESGKASPESDVYSFGALALEIACGRQPIDYTLHEHRCRLVAWVWDLHGQGNLLDAADQKLKGNFNSKQMEVVMLVGLLCSHPDPKARPTMREVLKILKFDTELPYVPRNLPVAVYSDGLTSHAESSSSEMLSTSNSLTSRSPASVRSKGKNSAHLRGELKPHYSVQT